MNAGHEWWFAVTLNQNMENRMTNLYGFQSESKAKAERESWKNKLSAEGLKHHVGIVFKAKNKDDAEQRASLF